MNKIPVFELYLRNCYHAVRAQKEAPMLQISQPDSDGVLECRLLPGLVVDNAEELTGTEPVHAELRLVRINELGGFIALSLSKMENFPWSDRVRFDSDSCSFVFRSNRSDELWDYNPGVRLRKGWNVFTCWPVHAPDGGRQYRLMWAGTTGKPVVWDGKHYKRSEIPVNKGVFEKFRER